MRITFSRFAAGALVAAAAMAGVDSFGIGTDYFTNEVLGFPVQAPKGLGQLVNATNRIAGYCLNFEDVFFFCGQAPEFTAFLEAYANVPVADGHQVILHKGLGEAKSPWAASGRPCDWKLYCCPKGAKAASALIKQGTNSVAAIQAAAKETNYVLVVHFWTGGHIPLAEVRIPPNVLVTKGQ